MDAGGFLDQVRGRLRRAVVLEGVARVVALALGIAAVVVAADFAWPTPGWFRFVALLSLLAAIVWLARARLVRPLGRAMDDRALAQFVERRLPALDGRLLTVVDGIALGAEDGALSAALTAGAADALVPAPGLPRWLALAGSALLAVALIGVIFPRFAHDAFARLFLPLGSAEWARGTTISGHLEPAVVASDRKMMLAIERHHWRGGRDDSDYQAPVTVTWQPLDGGHAESRQLAGLRGNAWQAPLPALPPGRYRITVESGDGVPLVLEGRSVTRPSLERVTATLTPPAYSKQPAQQLETLSCTALPGSRIDFAIAFATEPGRAIVRASASMHGADAADAAKPVAVKRTDRGISGSIVVAASGGSQLIVGAEDQDGIALDPPAVFAIARAEDRAPVVALDGPAGNEAVSTRAVVGVAIDASDDYALGALELRGQVLAARPAEAAGNDEVAAPASPASPPRTLAAFADAAGSATTSRRSEVEIGKLAALGEQLSLTGWARDTNDVTGPGETSSAPVLLRVVTDEALRQELDRLLAEARERASQAREELGSGLAKPDKLAGAARGAGIATAKCGELVAQVVRRWGENRLPAEQIAPAVKAGELVRSPATPKLGEAANGGGDAPAREADTALAQVEKLLGSLLQEGNLTRRLADLIAKQNNLNDESRAFVLEYLTKPIDAPAKTRQANIADRQRGVADEVKELERDVLAGASAQLDAAKALVRAEPSGDRLTQAAGDIASTKDRARAVETQKATLETLKKLLEALRGGDAAGDLADRIGDLAAKQEAVVKELESGTRPQELEKREKELEEQMKRVEEEAGKRDPDAGKAVAAAGAAAASAQKGMSEGDRPAAGRDAATAANLLREAQKKLGGDSKDKDKEKDKDKPKVPDVVALLRELLGLQTGLVADATILHLKLGDHELDFTSTRAIAAMAERQSDIVLRMREEGIKPLEQNPIATMALNRVAACMDKAAEHLATPALGDKGMRLEKIALAELSRLVDIAEHPSPPSGGGGGKGGGGGDQAPFPAQAEIALLAAMQEELSRLTDANRPGDLAKGEGDLRDLVEAMETHTRPGSRPNVLLSRSRRAMASAAALLGQKDRGLTTRHEQLTAEAELRRLLAEAKGGGGGGSGNPPPPRSDQKPQDQQPDAQKSDPKSGEGKGGASAGGGNKTGKKPTGEVTEVATDQKAGGLRLDLPEERREQLKQAREQNMAPRALQLYERYLELLEERK